MVTEKWVGIIVSGDKATVARVDFDDKNQGQLIDEVTWKLQEGDRSDAYAVMHRTVLTYISENKISHIAIRGSSASSRGTGQAHLMSAEVRGVVTAAAALSGAKVRVWTKAKTSKNVGGRNVDDYVKDNEFWKEQEQLSPLKKGWRDVVLLIQVVKKHERK